MRRRLGTVRSLEGILLIGAAWIGVGWILVNHTPVPNEVFLVGSVVVLAVVVWITRQVLSDHDE